MLTRVLLPLTYTVEGGVIGDLSPFSSWGRDGKRVHCPLETSQTSGRQTEASAPGRGSGPAGMGHPEWGQSLFLPHVLPWRPLGDLTGTSDLMHDQ